MAQTLASTLNRPVDPFSVVGQISRQPNVQTRGAEARKQLEPVMRAESEATGQAMRAEAGAARDVARQAADVEMQAVRGMEQAGATLEQAMAAYPQRQVQDFDPDAGLELAGMTALLGAFAGSLSGQSALKSMKGITQGYRAGKQDLYQREVAKYEADVQQYKDKISNAKTIYDNAIKLESQRRGAGLAKLKELEPLLQDSVITAKIRANDFTGAGKVIENAMKLADDLSSKLTEATAKAEAKTAEKAAESAAGLTAPPYDPNLKIHPAGVPISPINTYAGLTGEKQFETAFKEKTQESQKFIENLRQQDKKASDNLMIMERADGALRRMVQKAFDKAQKEGAIPKEAKLDLENMRVIGGNMPQVTGGVLGLPVIGTFIQGLVTANDKDAATYNAIAALYQRQSYVPGEGQVSNFERELFKQAAIDLGRPLLTNLEIIAATREAAKRQRQMTQFFIDYATVNRSLDGADKLWQAYTENNKILSVDANGNYKYNPNVPDYATWFKSKSGQPIQTLIPQTTGTLPPSNMPLPPSGPMTINTREEFDALPSGTIYIDGETGQRARKQ